MHTESTNPSGRVPALAGYEVLGKVGEGATGEVYRARQLDSHRVVAVKVLRPGPVAFNGRPWQLEPHVLTSLRHPHVVAILECVRSHDAAFLVLEYVEGVSLRGLMRAGEPWPIARARALLDAVADALSFIHGRGLLHLDLKPENVLCDPSAGTIKVTDFGLALHQAEVRPLTDLGTVQGTLDYCAPEQRFGLRVDARTDLFALATIAYELLTGRLPGRVFVPCTQRNPGLPAAVDGVLRTGLARHAEQRQAAVADFRRELNIALQPSLPSEVTG